MTGITVKELLSAEGTLAEKLLCSVTYPFEALKKIGDYIKEIGPALDKEIYEERGESIWIARSAKIAPSASITGPCIIGERTAPLRLYKGQRACWQRLRGGQFNRA